MSSATDISALDRYTYGANLTCARPGRSHVNTAPVELGGDAAAEEWAAKKLDAVVAYDLADFVALELPPIEWIVDGLLQRGDIGGVHGWRGVGKTYFCLSLGHAIACGDKFFGRDIPEPKGVLYVEGELPASELQRRLVELCAGSEEPACPFRILPGDLQDPPLPSLSTPEGQAAVEAQLDGIDVILLDSVSTLFRSEYSENDDKSWEAPQEWLLSLRRRGLTTVVVYHEGKGGAQRGTSKREDVLSQVLQLKTPADYLASQGARFEVHLKKARGVFGKEAEPFEVQLSTDQNGRAAWTWRNLESAKKDQVLELYLNGTKNQRVIASALDIGLGTVSRKLKELRDEGAI